MSKKFKLDFTKYYKNSFYRNQGYSVKRAIKFNSKKEELPLNVLQSSKPSDLTKCKDPLVFWFRNDLRVQDNVGLHQCIEDAKKRSLKVVGLYVISTRFWLAHLESPWKIALIRHALEKLSEELLKLNIPLSIVYLDDSAEGVEFPKWFESLLIETFRSNTVYFNIVYDYDELQRDIGVVKTNLNVFFFHDSCIVKPLTLKTKSTNTHFSKFSPWFKQWKEAIESTPFEIKKLQLKEAKFPSWDYSAVHRVDDYTLPLELSLSSLESFGVTQDDISSFKESIKNVDEAFVFKSLENWLKGESADYLKSKDFPSQPDSTSRISCFLSIGIISARQVYAACRDTVGPDKPKAHRDSVEGFLREVAFRDFYKHVLSNWPYLEFNVPFNFSSLSIELDEDRSKFEKWALGRTGFPIIDASMRKLLRTGYINNRCRMIVASFLAKDLNQDWRWGQNWFHHHLVDADFSSNSGGWQWCASVGVDAQPWFRIFNVYTQSQKFDPKGDFIREWVPELREVKDQKTIHTGDGVEGYALPIVDRDEERSKTLDRYRKALT